MHPALRRELQGARSTMCILNLLFDELYQQVCMYGTTPLCLLHPWLPMIQSGAVHRHHHSTRRDSVTSAGSYAAYLYSCPAWASSPEARYEYPQSCRLSLQDDKRDFSEASPAREGGFRCRVARRHLLYTDLINLSDCLRARPELPYSISHIPQPPPQIYYLTAPLPFSTPQSLFPLQSTPPSTDPSLQSP